MRWLDLGFTLFQPSEFLKPLFIVTIAWVLSMKDKDESLPVVPLTAVLTGVVALLLMQQPNLGETVIFVGRLGAADRPVGRVDALPLHARRGGGGAADFSPICSTTWRGSASTASCSPRATNIRWNRRCAR